MLCGILFFLSVIVATASVIGCTVVLRDVLDNAGHFVSELMPLYAICSTIVILTVCTIIDNLRITLLEKPLFKFLYNKISGFYRKGKGLLIQVNE